MDHKQLAKSKRESYANSGFDCSEIKSEKENSVFYSVKDEIFRLHEFTFSSTVTKVISRIEYEIGTGTPHNPIPAPVVEEPKVVETPVVEEPVVVELPEEPTVEEVKVADVKPAKKSSKKKGA